MKNSGILKYIIRITLFLLLAGFCLHHAERIFMGKDAEELSPYYYDYPGSLTPQSPTKPSGPYFFDQIKIFLYGNTVIYVVYCSL